jgi:glycine/D-amino acid oxidase-like deaminating enzyme
VIDCSGPAFAANMYFSRLPFALNKGEAIIASIPGLPRDAIYKYAQRSIVPWEEDRFWIGSTFDWDFTDEYPTEAFRARTVQTLAQWLRLPYELHEHFAAIRPATVTRDAFSGLHPMQPRVGILNGMGSKGCSLAPFLAHNLAAHLLQGAPLIPQVDVARYARVLSR